MCYCKASVNHGFGAYLVGMEECSCDANNCILYKMIQILKGKTKEIIYYIHSGVTLLEGKEMVPVWVFSHFLSSQAVCSALGSGAFVPMVTNANCLQGAKGSAWGSEWSLKDRKKTRASLEELSTKLLSNRGGSSLDRGPRMDFGQPSAGSHSQGVGRRPPIGWRPIPVGCSTGPDVLLRGRVGGRGGGKGL